MPAALAVSSAESSAVSEAEASASVSSSVASVAAAVVASVSAVSFDAVSEAAPQPVSILATIAVPSTPARNFFLNIIKNLLL